MTDVSQTIPEEYLSLNDDTSILPPIMPPMMPMMPAMASMMPMMPMMPIMPPIFDTTLDDISMKSTNKLAQDIYYVQSLDDSNTLSMQDWDFHANFYRKTKPSSFDSSKSHNMTLRNTKFIIDERIFTLPCRSVCKRQDVGNKTYFSRDICNIAFCPYFHEFDKSDRMQRNTNVFKLLCPKKLWYTEVCHYELIKGSGSCRMGDACPNSHANIDIIRDELINLRNAVITYNKKKQKTNTIQKSDESVMYVCMDENEMCMKCEKR